MNYDRVSLSMNRENEMIKGGFMKCHSELLNPSLSQTQKNNSLNNLNLLLTQSQEFYSALKKEFERKVSFGNFFHQEMKKFSENFTKFIRPFEKSFDHSIKCQVEAYTKILNESANGGDFDLLEIKESTEKDSKPLSEKQNEEILGKIFSRTQMEFEKLREKKSDVKYKTPQQKQSRDSENKENLKPLKIDQNQHYSRPSQNSARPQKKNNNEKPSKKEKKKFLECFLEAFTSCFRRN